MGKHKLTVVFGTEACRYADNYGVHAAVSKIKNEVIEGMYRTYELDTEADAEQLTQALSDAWGWDGNYFDTELIDGKLAIKFDD